METSDLTDERLAELERLRSELVAALTDAARSWDAFWAAFECVCPTKDRPTCRAIDRMRKAFAETEGRNA